MGASTKIAWCDMTFNPWIGCQKVSAGCAHCYAETWAKRWGRSNWGPAGTRQQTANWGDLFKWNREALREGVRRRVFCGSLCDVFEDHPTCNELRPSLWRVIRECRALDWLLLTKRPENIVRMLPPGFTAAKAPHVWFGASVENQAMADLRVPQLLAVPAAGRFLSCEPLLGPIDLGYRGAGGPARGWLRRQHGAAGSLPHQVDWVIVGGESGAGFRPMALEWARSLREQCAAAGAAFFFKQGSGIRSGMHEDLLGDVVQEFLR